MKKPMLLGTADVLIIGQTSGLQLFSGYLSGHTIEQSVDVSDLRGGRKNKMIGRIKTNKSVTVTVENLVQTAEFQAFMSGSELKKSTVTAYAMPKEVKYVEGGLTLSPAPKVGTTIPCELANGDKVVATFASNKLTITGAEAGETVLVGGYTYEASNAQTFKIQGDKFAENVTVVLEEDVYDGETMEIVDIKQTIIPLASPDENFSIACSRDLSENTVSSTFTALASGECNDLAYVVYLPAEEDACK